jgi:polyisoprenoid-binding protein YceI
MTPAPPDLTPLTGRWTLDPSRTTAAFHTKALWILKVRGTIRAVQGSATVGPDGRVDGELTFDVASVDTGIAKRDEHLRGSDFFDAANYPNLTFTATAINFDDATTAQVTGELTLHGQSRPVTLLASVTAAGPTAIVTGTATIDRRDWGVSMVKMGSGVLNRVEVTATFVRES